MRNDAPNFKQMSTGRKKMTVNPDLVCANLTNKRSVFNIKHKYMDCILYG